MIRVTVKQGVLDGNLEKLRSGKTYTSFKGIPYAKPPIGKLRFKAPHPPDNWTGVRDAKDHGGICPQVDMMSGVMIEGTDDCLYLNVYTPNLKTKYFPVMVWFHGGGFLSGSGDSVLYGPDYLIEEDVIIVTVNYRLEALGFLCLDTPDVPGNAGMKDQVAALRWIKENIKSFGGDPNNITAFGESAGGASATYHMASPMSKGLINKAIAQSGCFLHEWASCDRGKERAFLLAKSLGKETNDTEELLEFLQSLPPQQLTKVTRLTMSEEEKIRGIPLHFGPVVEKIFEGRECFLPKPAEVLLEENGLSDIPVIVGYTNKEGLINLSDTLRKAKAIDEHFERKVHRKIVARVTKKELKEIAVKIKEFYFGDKEVCIETSEAIIDLETDYNFSIGVIDFAQRLGKRFSSPVYLYRFSASSEFNMFKNNLGLSEYEGACHADDIFYLFKPFLDFDEASEGWGILKNMVKLWTNFAKHGNPTPACDKQLPVSWKPVKSNCLNFLDINTKLTPRKDPEKERFQLWMDIFNSVLRNNKNTLSHL